jgi:hypothetical protein
MSVHRSRPEAAVVRATDANDPKRTFLDLDQPRKASFRFRWVIDIGLPGPDRGHGGKYLIVPPGYDGPAPDGFSIARSRTNYAVWLPCPSSSCAWYTQ